MRGIDLAEAWATSFLAVLVFVITGGHVFFLPLLFLALGLFSFGHRRSRRKRGPFG